MRIQQETLTPTADIQTQMRMLKALIILSQWKTEGQDLFFQQYCHHSEFNPRVSNIPSCQVQPRERRHLLLVLLEESWFWTRTYKEKNSAALSHQAYKNNFLAAYSTSKFASIATAWQTWEQIQMLSPQGLWNEKVSNNEWMPSP